MFALLDALLSDIYAALKALFIGTEAVGSSFVKAIWNAGK